MTAACRESCCSATPRHTVSELFERGFRRNRQPPLAVEGIACSDAEGHSARFSLAVVDDRITRIGFRVSACATLIAYSELIAELTTDMRVNVASELTAQELIAALPGVHPLKQVRAVLALAAFRAALVAAARIERPHQGPQNSDEYQWGEA